MAASEDRPLAQRCIINRGSHRYLRDEAVYQQLFVAFALPSGGQIWANFYTLYGVCQIIPLVDRKNETKRMKMLASPPPHPHPMSLEEFCFLYLF